MGLLKMLAYWSIYAYVQALNQKTMLNLKQTPSSFFAVFLLQESLPNMVNPTCKLQKLTL